MKVSAKLVVGLVVAAGLVKILVSERCEAAERARTVEHGEAAR